MKDLLRNKTVLVSIIYALIQTVYCIIASICKIPALISVFVAVILFAVYFVALFFLNRTKKFAKESAKIDSTLTYKTINNSLYELSDLCNDSELKQELKAIADDFRFADPVSSSEMHDIENDIINLIEQIRDCLLSGDIQSSAEFTAKLRAAISTRNRLCKNNK
mgnify:CR=1 FL=1